MPTKTPDHVITAIENLWSEKENPKAKDVLADYTSLYRRKNPTWWSQLKLRRVQEIIAAKILGGDGAFERKEWKPWCTGIDPETHSFLLALDAVCQAVQFRHLYEHEATWGMRLRVALQELTPYDQFCFVSLYANRTVHAHYDKEDPVTVDLDIILAYKPWLSKHLHAFRMVGLARPASLGNSALTAETTVGRFPSFDWKVISWSLVLPWHIKPIRDEPKTPEELKALQAADAALRFWMGPNPIFLPPRGHEDLGLPDFSQPDAPRWTYAMDFGPESAPRIELAQASNTREETPE